MKTTTTTKRLLSLLLALGMLFSLMSASAFAEDENAEPVEENGILAPKSALAVGEKSNILSVSGNNILEQYMSACAGRYWNNDYSESDLMNLIPSTWIDATKESACDCGSNAHLQAYGCTSNTFGTGRQCLGFARYLYWLYSGVKEQSSDWLMSVGSDYIFKIGDMINYKNGSNYHAVIVYSVNGDTLTLAEANWYGRCKISCTRQMSRSEAISLVNTTDDYSYTIPSKNNAPQNKYYIYFDKNGGDGSISPLGLNYNDNFNIPTNTFSRSGYEFKGWNLHRNADDKWYVSGEGWKTESEISQNGYTKKLYSDGQNLSLSGSWIKDYDGVSSYTFYAVWERYYPFTYNSLYAAEWAKSWDNINSVDGICARFVSACLRAGGLTDIDYGYPEDIVNHVVNCGYGTVMDISDASFARLKAGDFIVVLCSNHAALHGLHTIFVTEVNHDEGYIRYSAKNNNHCNEKMTFSSIRNYSSYFPCNICETTNDSYTALVSMNATDIEYNYGSEMTTGYPRTIPDGKYIIAPAADNNFTFFLDIEGTQIPADSGTNVSICATSSADVYPGECDIWDISYSDGFYTFRQMNTNQCLDVMNGDMRDRANVQCYEDNSSSSQRWAISRNPTGYKIQSKRSGFMLDNTGGVLKNENNVQLYGDNQSLAQSWVFIPYYPEQTLPTGRYVLLSEVDNSFELDVDRESGINPDHPNIQIWSDTTSSRYNSFDVTALDNGYYELKNAATGKVLDVCYGSRASGENVQLYEDIDTVGQQWAITKDGVNGGYTLRVRSSGMTLDLQASSTVNGANVIQYYFTGAANQTWKFIKAEYAVKYASPHGTGIPALQTKYYKEDLTLSDLVPTCEGYTFLGWATSSTAAEAQYQPGDSYTADADVTLYAVWDDGTYSDWTPDKPTDVDESLLQTASQYRYRTVETTTSKDPNLQLQGWTSSGSHTEYGDYGSWSDWSRSYVASNDTTQTETKVFYRYYYFQCPNCGNHTAYHGTCWCDTQVPEETYHEIWYPTPYSSSNSFEYNSNKSATDSLDGQRWYFDTSNLYSTSVGTTCNSGEIVIDSFYRYRTRTIQTIYDYWRWGEWNSWGFTPVEENENTQVEWRTVYRYPEIIISYNANGGSNAPQAQAKKENIDLILSSTVPTRDGYIFLGWATDAEAAEAQYQPGDSYTEDADVTLYAVWCSRSEALTLPAALTKIEAEAFTGVTAQVIVVPATVTEIGSKAFAYCPNLREVIFLGKPASIAEDYLDGCGTVDVVTP